MKSPRNIRDRILILAPAGRDADLAARALSEAGLIPEVCATIEDFCQNVLAGAGAGMITEEALELDAMRCLRETVERQAAWSDFPLLIFTSQPAKEVAVQSFDAAGPRANITLIERPIRIKTMISAAETALRARRRQYEVRDLLHELQRRVDERDQFLAMLSHELRNPLAAMSLALSDAGGVQLETSSDEREILVRQTRHLSKLVDDLLDIGRVTSGKIILNRAPVDLADIVAHCVETVRPEVERRGLTLDVRLSLRHAGLRADSVRLEQVVNNLLSNALKYTPAGGRVMVSLEQEESEAVLRVGDSGKGIAPEMLTRIFELFMQGDVAIDRSEGGMGIGLTLVRTLVELHDGTVRAYSSGPGNGSEFVVRLPLPERVEPAPRQADAPITLARPLNIVVVDDNPDVRALLRAKLRKLGHDVQVAEDGLQAVDIVVASKPHVALVDIGLPGIDGYEVARRVRSILGPDIYLVALTGYGQTEDRRRAIDAGFDVHLTKPADVADLQNVLAKFSPAGSSL